MITLAEAYIQVRDGTYYHVVILTNVNLVSDLGA